MSAARNATFVRSHFLDFDLWLTSTEKLAAAVQCPGLAPGLILLLQTSYSFGCKENHVNTGWLAANTHGNPGVKLTRCASMHNTRTLALLYGMQRLLMVTVTPPGHKTACSLWGSATARNLKCRSLKNRNKHLLDCCHLFCMSAVYQCWCNFTSITGLIVMQTVCLILQEGTMVQTLEWNSTCHSNMNLCCNFGSLMKCFQHAWLLHLLWKTVYVHWNDAAVMDSLVWDKWTRQGEKTRLRENSQSGNWLLEHKLRYSLFYEPNLMPALSKKLLSCE